MVTKVRKKEGRKGGEERGRGAVAGIPGSNPGGPTFSSHRRIFDTPAARRDWRKPVTDSGRGCRLLVHKNMARVSQNSMRCGNWSHS